MKKWLILLAGLCPLLFAQTRMIPHITSPTGGFSTQLVVVNQTNSAQNYVLTPYSQSGAEGVVFQGQAFAGESQFFEIDALFAERPAHLTINADPNVIFSIAYQAEHEGASPAHLHETAFSATRWRILPGNWDIVWDGFAAVNNGDAPTRITISQILSDGSVLGTGEVIARLAPNAKTLYVIRDHFVSREDSFFVVEADQALALTALRGDLNSDFLWENAGWPIDAIVGESSARYTVTFTSSWSAQTHPNGFPANPHFSGLIGATHHAGVRFWREGEPASPGIQSMAETGSKQPLTNEIQAAIGDGLAESLLSGGGIGNSPGAVSLSFEITQSHPLATLVSMIAPSPDWFVGVDGLRLFENGAWVDRMVVNLYAYDAGTDSGAEYTAPNQATSPPESTHRIPVSPFLIDGKAPPIGVFTFVKE